MIQRRCSVHSISTLTMITALLVAVASPASSVAPQDAGATVDRAAGPSTTTTGTATDLAPRSVARVDWGWATLCVKASFAGQWGPYGGKDLQIWAWTRVSAGEPLRWMNTGRTAHTRPYDGCLTEPLPTTNWFQFRAFERLANGVTFVGHSKWFRVSGGQRTTRVPTLYLNKAYL